MSANRKVLLKNKIFFSFSQKNNFIIAVQKICKSKLSVFKILTIFVIMIMAKLPAYIKIRTIISFLEYINVITFLIFLKLD